MLLVVLHDDQASDAEDVVATELDWAPFDLHAHRTGIVVNLGDVAKDLGVDFGTDCFGKMLRKLWVLNLTREGLLHPESSSLVEFCDLVSN